jgi:hypothetical protein
MGALLTTVVLNVTVLHVEESRPLAQRARWALMHL